MGAFYLKMFQGLISPTVICRGEFWAKIDIEQERGKFPLKIGA